MKMISDMKQAILFFFFLSASIVNFSQNIQQTEAISNLKDSVLTHVDSMPSFPGGDMALYKFLQRNIYYPNKERENWIQGKVYVEFTVDTNGRIMNIKEKKGVPEGKGLSEEAIRVVKIMPKWKPGSQNGKKVSVQIIFPVIFKLKPATLIRKDHNFMGWYENGTLYCEDNDTNASYIIPEFPEGTNGINEYLRKAIKYPEKEKSYNVAGTIFVEFTIDEQGKVTQAKEKDNKLDFPGLAAEAIRVVSKMPAWSAGTKDGKPIKMKIVLPIIFSK